MYASMPDTITSVTRSAQRDGSLTRKRENQHNTSSGPPKWLRQNARGTSDLGNPEEELEK
ncbi:hypothetical protein E2C01_070380 [Portunus trituberculatus]|uniref:Uncharacterized protein n=1 Tax=Portunus trituberculatus TaxID=210409 RepID=A0A5B7I239_PORTR|nr:hypothetical protein [Portunus trituberculatus]